MSSDPGPDRVLHPEPTPAEREAVRLALARLTRAELLGLREVSAWRVAGLQESIDRAPQEAVPRSNRGATRA